jgi:hypothetical protein
VDIVGRLVSAHGRSRALAAALALMVLMGAQQARASMTVLVGEPYGSFGTLLPVGHAAIYLDRVCADSPLKLRLCLPNEPMGVVLSRYHHLGQYDWVASPANPIASQKQSTIPTTSSEE